MIKTLSIVGARPQFVKLAPVSRAMKNTGGELDGEIKDLILHTGQHYDDAMSDIFFDQLEIPTPDIHLNVGSGSHGAQTGRMLEGIEKVILEQKPDLVVVYGDTNSTAAGALAASKLHVPIVHVEAGLRSFDRTMPEEVNRLIADHLSELLLAPTETAMQNLQVEGLQQRSVNVGDVMLDAVMHNMQLAKSQSDIVEDMGLAGEDFVLATMHRPANTDGERLLPMLNTFNKIAKDHAPVIFPVHPRALARIKRDLADWKPHVRLQLTDPIGPLDMLSLVNAAKVVMTDSGGLQKEAFFLNTPCVTLRSKTEWVETVDAGANVLVGAEPAAIESAVADWLSADAKQFDVQHYFGNGDAAHKITEQILLLANGR